MKWILASLPLFFYACSDSSNLELSTELNKDERTYWQSGVAEINSYRLSQARYGELHEGAAVLIYVTEPFSKTGFTKTTEEDSNAEIVLKLNHTRNFTTGIYPYSTMTSTFFPFEGATASYKLTSSVQEWCGQTFVEVKNNDYLTIDQFSYFENESKTQGFKLTYLEDDVWNWIRLSPKNLPTGKAEMIPMMTYLLMEHIPVEPYPVELTKVTIDETQFQYEIDYFDLKRTVTIQFDQAFPHKITKWTESYYSSDVLLETTASLDRTLQTDFWNKNGTKDEHWRDSLYQP